MVKSRVKKPISIVEKLQRRGLPVSLESMMENLDDVAGIRVICSFLDDIYAVADMLARQDDVHIIAIKDYIRHPKKNGYRSYHMIVEIPVFFSDQKKWMRAEVQIRTIAMDFWASLEHKIYYKFEGNAPERISKELKECAEIVHQLKYKKEVEEYSQEISEELRECADVIAQTDERMLDIRKRIEDHGIAVSK